jgi:hypothetical protein
MPVQRLGIWNNPLLPLSAYLPTVGMPVQRLGIWNWSMLASAEIKEGGRNACPEAWYLELRYP